MLLDTGARAGKELLNLKWNQIKTDTNPQFINTGELEANEWGEGEEKVLFNLNRIVWMPVDGKTGVRTIVGFDRTYRVLNAIAQRNYGKTAEEVIKAKIPDHVIRTKKKEQPKKFDTMFTSYLKEHNLLIDPKTEQKRVLYSLRHTYATLLVEKDAVDVFLLELQMGTSVEMIRKHYGHVNILKAAEHLKAGRARQLFKGVGQMNEIYRSKLVS
jgi:integrase